MDAILSTVLSTSIPAVISIIGFIVTYASMKRNFQYELNKQKSTIQLEKMSSMPFEVLSFMQEIIDSGKTKKGLLENQLKSKMEILFHTIFAYGSPSSIRILATMQSENYLNAKSPESANTYRMMSFYILLATQIRYDITGQIISPEEWFKMRLTDYNSSKDKFVIANNTLVKELELNKGFIIS